MEFGGNGNLFDSSQRSTRDVPSLATCPVVLDDSKGEHALDERFFSDAEIGVQELTNPRGLAAREAIENALVSARRAKLARYVGVRPPERGRDHG